MRLSDADILYLIPGFMRDDNAVVALAKVVNELITEPGGRVKRLRSWDRIDDLDHADLDELAWELNVDWYNSALDLKRKRETIKISDQVHAKRGTKRAVERIIAEYFGPGYIQEWFEYMGSPYHFRAIMRMDEHADLIDIGKLEATINSVKNARSKFDGVIPLYICTLNIITLLNKWFSEVLDSCGSIRTLKIPFIATLGRRHINLATDKLNSYMSNVLSRAGPFHYPTPTTLGHRYIDLVTDELASYLSSILARAAPYTYPFVTTNGRRYVEQITDQHNAWLSSILARAGPDMYPLTVTQGRRFTDLLNDELAVYWSSAFRLAMNTVGRLLVDDSLIDSMQSYPSTELLRASEDAFVASVTDGLSYAEWFTDKLEAYSSSVIRLASASLGMSYGEGIVDSLSKYLSSVIRLASGSKGMSHGEGVMDSLSKYLSTKLTPVSPTTYCKGGY